MKKLIAIILVATTLLSIASIASAAVSFTLRTPCEALADNQLYKYCASVFEYKGGSDHKIFVSHHVTQTSAVETNRIAAYSDLTKKTMGANWHRADSGLYQCMSNAISSGSEYTVAGRGNTNYQSKYGLNSITLTGYFRADND